MKRAVLAFIKLYAAAVSPFLGRNCRFHPTCSAYTSEAIETHGVLKGGWLGTKRILKCQPFHKGPIADPVPPKPSSLID
jgi:putative membrane protein insertion efficiency factor